MEHDVTDFFTDVPNSVTYEGPDSDNSFAYRWYDKDRMVTGKRMEDQLRMAVCYWHSFAWPGADNIDPAPVSGQQELIETIVNRTIERIS